MDLIFLNAKFDVVGMSAYPEYGFPYDEQTMNYVEISQCLPFKSFSIGAQMGPIGISAMDTQYFDRHVHDHSALSLFSFGADFIKGADISWVPGQESRGIYTVPFFGSTLFMMYCL